MSRRAVVVGVGPAAPIALSALRRGGLEVDAVTPLFTSLDEVRAAIGVADVVVHAHLAPESLRPRTLASLSEAEWEQAAEAPVRAALLVAQTAWTCASRLIFVCPTVGMEGAAEFVPLASASEAIRTLAKSAARRWAGRGMTVNVVAPALADLQPSLIGTDVARTPASLAAAGGLDPLGDAVAWLGGPGGASMTGATIVADRGALMTP